MQDEFVRRIGKVGVLFLIFLIISYLFIPSFSQKKVIVKIPKGASSKEISHILWERKIITNPYFFSLIVKILNFETTLKAGTYEFTSPTLLSVIKKLREGKVKLYKVTFPEGLPRWEVAAILAERGIVDKKKFLQVVEKAEYFYDDFPWLKGVKSLEGYLFPDTYYFTLEEDPVKVAERFLSKFEKIVLPLYQKNTKKTKLSLHEAVTLASIVEKEAKFNFEKSVIAGVFYNRLNKGMKLMADPTVKYALGDFSKKLSKELLTYPSSYNTYLHSGLPPGPICSPGIESIKAVIHPAQVEYLYFVARGDGTHKFSTTYEEHLKAIKTYQRG